MGDPKAYGANLPGVQVITGLAQIYQQGSRTRRIGPPSPIHKHQAHG